MELITIVFCLILLVYVVVILQLILGFDKVKSFERTAIAPKTAFTIIVPFRNEAKNLEKLLRSFSKLNYPHELIEIIMVDDLSTDSSERICIRWRLNHSTIDTTLLENLRLSRSPKKDAIARAMPIAKHNWIITTDADCIVPKNWLLTFDNYIQNNTVEMLVGAVVYKTKNNWFHQFQQLDLLSLQGTTIGSFGIGKPFMCNGANFAYTKSLFYELDGFNGNERIASGDDVFLLQKAVQKATEKVHYIKNTENIVKTKPENDLYKLFMQRVRWASKTTSYHDSFSKFVAVIVLLMNLSLLVGFGLVSFGSRTWNLEFGIWCLVFVFLVKYIVDYVLLYKANQYLLKGKFLLPVASSFIYPFYASFIGIYSLFGTFTWKGKVYRK
jgi:cellulose synthase/poly-beta-1,6-N-acetylglucosamine synthase-like glycosyltransferase